MIQIIFKQNLHIIEKTVNFAIRIIETTMIQRIQTLFLIVVVLISAALPFVFPLFTLEDGTKVFAENNLAMMITFIAVAILAVVAIFLFKKRQNQFVINRLNLIVNLILLGFFVYRSLNLSGETAVSEKGIGMLIPVFSIVFLVLANRAIKKDEDLVKSVDRLR